MKKTMCWLLLAGLLAGCASYFKRKDCEKMNWYQHGYDVAMAGKRLDADDTIKQCQKVEAKMSFTELDTGFKAGMGTYCTDDNVYAVGKSGNLFSFDMCDGQSEKKMRARYSDGLRVFCTPASAYRFGASGGIYQNVCSKKEEEPWLTEYRKGRKIWLAAVIKEKELRRQQIQADINQLQRRRASYMNEQRSIISIPVVHREQIYDPKTGTYQEHVTQTPDEGAARHREQLSQQVNQIDYEIRGKTDEQSKLDTELSQMRTELATL
jgi:hypothetical protein